MLVMEKREDVVGLSQASGVQLYKSLTESVSYDGCWVQLVGGPWWVDLWSGCLV